MFSIYIQIVCDFPRNTWYHLNSMGPTFVDRGCFAYSLELDFADASVFSFNNKDHSLLFSSRVYIRSGGLLTK